MHLATSTKTVSKNRTLFLFIALMSYLISYSSFTAAETYYKWKNESGSWKYGAHPPADVEAIVIETTSGRNKSALKAQQDTAKVEESDNTRSQSGGELFATQKQKIPKKERNRLCKAAKSNLESLQSSALIRRRDADGKVTTLSDKERQTEIDTAKQASKDYCK